MDSIDEQERLGWRTSGSTSGWLSSRPAPVNSFNAMLLRFFHLRDPDRGRFGLCRFGDDLSQLFRGSNGSGVYVNQGGTWKNYNFFALPRNGHQGGPDRYPYRGGGSTDGTIFAGSYYGGLMEIEGDQITFHQKENSALQGAVGDEQREQVGGLVLDRKGNLWIAEHWLPIRWSCIRPTGVEELSTHRQYPSSSRALSTTRTTSGLCSGREASWCITKERPAIGRSDDRVRIIDAGSGNLPSNKVVSVGLDLDGEGLDRHR